MALLIDGDLKVLDFVCEMVKEYNKDNKNLLLAVMATDTKNPSAASELKKAWEEKKKRYEEEEKKRKDEEETKKKKNEDAQGEPSKPQRFILLIIIIIMIREKMIKSTSDYAFSIYFTTFPVEVNFLFW